MVIFAEDFNACGPTEVPGAKSYKQALMKLVSPSQQLILQPGFDRYEEALAKEYETLIKIMSNKGKTELVDCLTTANKGQCQVTYADIVRDDPKVTPVESVLTGAEDNCTCQCLDYIFLIGNKNEPKTVGETLEERDTDRASDKLLQTKPGKKVTSGDGANTRIQGSSRLILDVNSTKVERFFVKGHPFTQLSDHFGISTTLHLVD